jgi:hypothetical protein
MGTKGCTSAPPPKTPPPLQDPCGGNKICNAQSDANQGSNVFWKIAGWLLLGAGLAEAAALLLEALAGALAGSILLAWLAPIVSGIGALAESLATAAGLAAVLAGLVATEFGQQAALHTPRDWSRSAMYDFGQEVGDTIAPGIVAIGAIVSIKTLLGAVATKVGGVLGAAQPALLKTVQLFNNYGNIVAGGSFMNEADYWIGRMNSDLRYA